MPKTLLGMMPPGPFYPLSSDTFQRPPHSFPASSPPLCPLSAAWLVARESYAIDRALRAPTQPAAAEN